MPEAATPKSALAPSEVAAGFLPGLVLSVAMATAFPAYFAIVTWIWLIAVHTSLWMAGWWLVRSFLPTHRSLALFSAFGLAAAIALVLREQWLPSGVGESLFEPVPAAQYLAVSVVIGLAVFAGATRMGPIARGVTRTAIATALSVVLLVGAALGPDALRWHLFQHNRLLGAATHHLVSGLLEDGLSSLLLGAETPESERFIEQGFSPPPSVPARPDDVLLILVDTLRADALSQLGGHSGRMPVVDALAANSILLSNVLSTASWTRPSTASLMTGLAPEEHGAIDWEMMLPDESVTLAEEFSALDYSTAGINSNYPGAGSHLGFAQGFDEYLEPDHEPYKYARADLITTQAVELAANAPADYPLFLYVHYMDPHGPYYSGGPEHARSHAVAIDAYRRETEFVDGWIGRLIAEVTEKRGRAPIILLTADHGEEFGEHGARGHGKNLYRESIHVPGVLSIPGQTAPAVVDARLSLADLGQLLLDAVAEGPALDAQAWGRDRDRAVRHASRYILHSQDHPLIKLVRPWRASIAMRGVDTGDWFAAESSYGDTLELYDLERDPAQLENVLATDSAAGRATLEALEGAPGVQILGRPFAVSNDMIDQLKALGYVQ